jgi:hypothetical protein
MIGLLQGDLCDTIVVCADVPAEDKTCDKGGLFCRTLEVLLITLSLLKIVLRESILLRESIFKQESITERVFETGKDVTCIFEMYCSFHMTEKICGTFEWKLWPKGAFF